MCTFMQNGRWWYEFTVRGKRTRRSSRVTNRELAELIAAEHQSRVEENIGNESPMLEAIEAEKKAARLPMPTPALTGSAPTPISPSMTLKEAGLLWLEAKAWQRRKPKTLECNRAYLWNLLQYFGDIPLADFHAGSIREYQIERQKAVGASSVNHEMITLGGILRRAGLWAKISGHYSALPTPHWQKPKVFTPEEKNLIFEAVASSPDFELASIVFAITGHTSASGSELRLARLRQVNLNGALPNFEVTGDTTKNMIRPRVLPLDEAAEDAFRRAVARANRLGAYLPDHFIFPLRKNRAEWDPTRPASSSWLRKQTQQLKELTGIPHIRPHAWRHQLCTELLEKGASTQTVKEVMGWCSERMISTYSHARLESKRDVLALLSRLGQASDTSEDILANPAVQAEIERQVKFALGQQATVRPNGTRGHAPLRVVSFPNNRPFQGGTR